MFANYTNFRKRVHT